MADNGSKISSPHTQEEMKRLREVAAMVKSGTSSEIVQLKEIALHDQNPKVRYYAKKGMLIIKRKIGKTQAIPESQAASPEQVQVMLRAPDPDTRMNALKAIARQQIENLVTEVAALLPGETDLRVKATMASLLGRMGSVAHVSVLQPLLKDADARIRANTVAACMRLDVEKAAPDIIPLLKDVDNRCRANAVAALKELGSNEVIDTLGEMMSSRAVHMQESAAFVLDVFPFPRIKPLLIEGAKSEFAIVRTRIRAILEQFADEGLDEAAELFMTLFPEEEETASADLADEPEKNEAEEIFERLGDLESMSGESENLKQQQETADHLVGNLAAISQKSFGSYEDVVKNESAMKETVHRKLEVLKVLADDGEDSGELEEDPLLQSLKTLSETSPPVKEFSFDHEIDIKPKLETPAAEIPPDADPGEEVFEKLRNIG